jgi:hypothetical protein
MSSNNQGEKSRSKKPGSESIFQDPFYIRPGTPKEADVNVPQQSTVMATYFANLFREWFREGKIAFDTETHLNFQELVLQYIKQTASVTMVMEDVKVSRRTVGINLPLDTDALRTIAENMLDIKLLKNMADLLGLSEYVDDLVGIELEKKFGTTLERSRVAQKRRQHVLDQERWLRETAAGIHNIVRDISSTLKSEASKQPKPITANLRDKATSQILRELKHNQETSSESEGGFPEQS